MLKALVGPAEIGSQYLLRWRQSLQGALVYSRPSAAVKSPYLADVRLTEGSSNPDRGECCNDLDERSIGITIAHAPSLGCGGLVEEGRHVHVAALQQSKSGAKTTRHSTHRVVAATDTTPDKCVVGIDPLLPNSIAEALLQRHGWELGSAKAANAEVAEISHAQQRHQAEVAFKDSRFDFVSTFLRGSVPSAVVTEVKSVPLTNVSLTRRRRSASNNPVGLFPFVPKYSEIRAQTRQKILSRAQAQRQFKASARLCKHLLELGSMTQRGPNTVQTGVGPHTVLGRQVLFVATRPDVSKIVLTTRNNPSLTDAVAAAVSAGVRLVACSTRWDAEGVAFVRWLPVLTDGASSHSRFAAAKDSLPTALDGETPSATLEPWRVSETHQVAEVKRLQQVGGTGASLGVSQFGDALQDAKQSCCDPVKKRTAGHAGNRRPEQRQSSTSSKAKTVYLEGEAELEARLGRQQLLSDASIALFEREAFPEPNYLPYGTLHK